MRIVWLVVLAIGLVTSLLQLLPGEAVYFWDRVPGFWAVFGFAGCVILTFFAKWIGGGWLQKEENYYDERG